MNTPNNKKHRFEGNFLIIEVTNEGLYLSLNRDGKAELKEFEMEPIEGEVAPEFSRNDDHILNDLFESWATNNSFQYSTQSLGLTEATSIWLPIGSGAEMILAKKGLIKSKEYNEDLDSLNPENYHVWYHANYMTESILGSIYKNSRVFFEKL